MSLSVPKPETSNKKKLYCVNWEKMLALCTHFRCQTVLKFFIFHLKIMLKTEYSYRTRQVQTPENQQFRS